MKIILVLILCLFFVFSCKEKKNIENTTEVNIVVDLLDPIEEIKGFEAEETSKEVLSQTDIKINIPEKLFQDPMMITTAVEIEKELALQYPLTFVEDENDIGHYYQPFYLLKNFPDSNCDIKFIFRDGFLYYYSYSYNLNKLNIINKQDFIKKTVDQFENEFGRMRSAWGTVVEFTNYEWWALYAWVQIELYTNSSNEDLLDVIVYSFEYKGVF
jgi:ABC-type antimicrobial peptide transport system permease subunit